MSYDFDGDPRGVKNQPPEPFTIRRWFEKHYWRFVIWCALDAKSRRVSATMNIYKALQDIAS